MRSRSGVDGMSSFAQTYTKQSTGVVGSQSVVRCVKIPKTRNPVRRQATGTCILVFLAFNPQFPRVTTSTLSNSQTCMLHTGVHVPPKAPVPPPTATPPKPSPGATPSLALSLPSRSFRAAAPPGVGLTLTRMPALPYWSRSLVARKREPVTRTLTRRCFDWRAVEGRRFRMLFTLHLSYR